jgi:epoxyqueuosine reductase
LIVPLHFLLCGTINWMLAAVDTNWVTERAKELGFDLCGIVCAETFPELAQFEEWLERGYAGEMKYLEDPRRRDPRQVLKDAHSMIVCAINYNTARPYSTDCAAASEPAGPRGWISRYAWGRDYHEVLWERLNALTASLREKFPEHFAARAYADTGPIAERIFAKYAGLGWIGKNTLLLNQELGSWLFLGVILTSLELAPSLESPALPPADRCGNCRQCLDACPTGALVEPYVMDARRCISYLTIELRGSIPEEFRESMGRQVYGCDICQDVCPFNRKAPTTSMMDFQPRQTASGQSLFQPSLEWLAGMEADEFRRTFRGSAIKRAKWSSLVRNACIALGNASLLRNSDEHSRAVALLRRLAKSPDVHIAESAQWALARIE